MNVVVVVVVIYCFLCGCVCHHCTLLSIAFLQQQSLVETFVTPAIVCVSLYQLMLVLFMLHLTIIIIVVVIVFNVGQVTS